MLLNEINLITLLFFIFNKLILINTKINYLIRVDNIAPTCLQRPTCKQYYNLDGSIVNVDKSLSFMGNSICCIEFINDENSEALSIHNGYLVKILRPTFFIGKDSLSIYENKIINGSLIDELTSNDTNLYRDIFINSSTLTIEFNKDKYSKSIFEILITSLKLPTNNMNKNQTSYLDFYCNKSNMYISNDLVCDRYPHCSFNEDEWFDCEDDLNNSNDKLIWNELRPKIMFIFSLMIILIITLLISFLLIYIIETRNNWFCYKLSNNNNNTKNDDDDDYDCIDRKHRNRRQKLNDIY
jgi:hypothetical protein